MAALIKDISLCPSAAYYVYKDFQVNELSIDCPDSIQPFPSPILFSQDSENLIFR